MFESKEQKERSELLKQRLKVMAVCMSCIIRISFSSAINFPMPLWRYMDPFGKPVCSTCLRSSMVTASGKLTNCQTMRYSGDAERPSWMLVLGNVSSSMTRLRFSVAILFRSGREFAGEGNTAASLKDSLHHCIIFPLNIALAAESIYRYGGLRSRTALGRAA